MAVTIRKYTKPDKKKQEPSATPVPRAAPSPIKPQPITTPEAPRKERSKDDKWLPPGTELAQIGKGRALVPKTPSLLGKKEKIAPIKATNSAARNPAVEKQKDANAKKAASISTSAEKAASKKETPKGLGGMAAEARKKETAKKSTYTRIPAAYGRPKPKAR